MRTHGGLTEDSRTHSLNAPIGKGREGKGREKEGKRCRDLICGCSNSDSLHASEGRRARKSACNEIHGWSTCR